MVGFSSKLFPTKDEIEVLCFYKFNEGCEHEIRYGSSSLFTEMREQKVNIIIKFRINN